MSKSEEPLADWPVDIVPSPAPETFQFIRQLGEEVDSISPARFLPFEETDVPGFSRFTLTLHRPERTQPEELRQYKALCDRLLPGTRYGSHLYTLVHLDGTTYSVTLSEYGEVIGGTTVRFIQVRPMREQCDQASKWAASGERSRGECAPRGNAAQAP